jgi:hypothetical protein
MFHLNDMAVEGVVPHVKRKETIMTFQDDPNRPRPAADPLLNRDANGRRIEGTGMGWGIPLAIAAVVLIGGLFLYSSGTDRTTTASNTPVTTTTKPAPAPMNPPAANPPTANNPAPPVTAPKQ